MIAVPEDVEQVAGRCHELLTRRGETVATAESLTGGLLGAALTSTSGASASYRSGVIAYAVDQKVSLLGVPEPVLARFGPVHAETASAMSVGARDRLGATYGLATTGVAGPASHGDQPVGTVYVACAGPTGRPTVRHLRLPGTRQQVRAGAVAAALELLQAVLRDTQDAVSACRPDPGYGGSQIQGDRDDEMGARREPGER